ncbi:MAG: hypothetical protein R2939_01140 [Kofleriaceae bacterium]
MWTSMAPPAAVIAAAVVSARAGVTQPSREATWSWTGADSDA